MCKTTRDHHKALGDVAGTNRFENLALSVQKDIDILKIARRNKVAVPKFHYEKKSFNIVKSNTDLTENELEINVVRGISYVVANPKDVDTFVKFEFPYPQVSWTGVKATFEFILLGRFSVESFVTLPLSNRLITKSRFCFRKRHSRLKLNWFATRTVPITMRNSLQKFSRKWETVSESSSDMPSNLKSIPKGKSELAVSLLLLFLRCSTLKSPTDTINLCCWEVALYTIPQRFR